MHRDAADPFVLEYFPVVCTRRYSRLMLGIRRPRRRERIATGVVLAITVACVLTATTFAIATPFYMLLGWTGMHTPRMFGFVLLGWFVLALIPSCVLIYRLHAGVFRRHSRIVTIFPDGRVRVRVPERRFITASSIMLDKSRGRQRLPHGTLVTRTLAFRNGDTQELEICFVASRDEMLNFCDEANARLRSIAQAQSDRTDGSRR